MIKVLYVISTLRACGPVNVLYNMIKNFDKNLYNIYIITLSSENPTNSRWQEFVDMGCVVKSLNLSRIIGYLYGGIKIKNIVDEINPNLIHAHCFRSILFSGIYLKNYKKIATIHSDYDIDYTLSYGKYIGKIMSKLMDFSLSKFDKCICVSELLFDILKKKKKLSLDFVNNGVDTDKFKPAKNKIELRKNLKLPTDKTIWIWVGNLINLKNPSFLVKNIKNYKNDDIFIFCGNGELYTILKQQTQNFKNIIFTGNVSNIEEYLQASDYYISTSTSEGIGLSVLEALSCALPAILSDIDVFKYILKKGDAGLIFKNNNSHDLNCKIKQILNNNYYELSKNARNLVLNKFSAEIMSKNYQIKYEELYAKN